MDPTQTFNGALNALFNDHGSGQLNEFFDPPHDLPLAVNTTSAPSSPGERLLTYLAPAIRQHIVPGLQDGPSLPEGPVALQVDLLGLAQEDPGLAGALLQDPEALRQALLAALYDQGLALNPCYRVWLRPCAAPLPLLPQPALAAQATAYGAHIASFYGLVATVTTVGQRTYSRLVRCTCCGFSGQVLEGQGLHCCEVQAASSPGSALQEDLAGRVMVPYQEIWVSGLDSALPGRGHYARSRAVRVFCLDDLAGSAKIGDVIRVVGRVKTLGPANTGGSRGTLTLQRTGTLEVEALSLSGVVPHAAAWLTDGMEVSCSLGAAAAAATATARTRAALSSAVARTGRPLQALYDLMQDLQARYLEPLTCLALLASAATVCSASSSPGAQAGAPSGPAQGQKQQAQQLSILLGCDPQDPITPRMLRSMAALLSPHSTALNAHSDQPVAPHVKEGNGTTDLDGQACVVVHGSQLLCANNGIAVIDADMLTTNYAETIATHIGDWRRAGVCMLHAFLPGRSKAQLKDVLGKPQLQLKAGRIELNTPVTPVVWAAAGRCTRTTGGKRVWGAAEPQKGAWSGLDEGAFDLVLPYSVEDDVIAAMVLDGGVHKGLPDGPRSEAPDVRQAREALQQHMAMAVLLPCPQLSDGALETLTRYFVSVRQASVQISHAEALGTIIKIAVACARLHLRSTVLEAPDCVLAVLLMEQHLACRFDDMYCGLGLPVLADVLGQDVDGCLDASLKSMLAALTCSLGPFRAVGGLEE